ncbi:hypothetical protein D9758_003239 [Tetrapyrgos nigripes]|uniref:Uncharacterized protein n=1 Tax=Tetrapyrgos nigripes TaxID=182062 RepID=A0A8H5LPZ3_9AGAR|nr:hypothetical protein D9758_003239 [Tetrapyrgos nigripes]
MSHLALCAVISLVCSITFGALLLREWNFYDITQRSVVLALAILHGVGAILLYLMIVVRFRIWLDVARISFYLVSLLGGNTFFAVVNATYPCNNLGSHALCRHVTWSVIIGSWVQSGLLIVYSVFLAVASHARPSVRPQITISPPPPMRELGYKTGSDLRSRKGSVESFASTTRLLSYDDKRSSLSSTDSFGSSPDARNLQTPGNAVPVMFPAPHSSKGSGWGTSFPLPRTPMSSYTPRPYSPAASVQSLPATLTFQQPSYASHYRQSSSPIRSLPIVHPGRDGPNPFRTISPPEYSSLRNVSARPPPFPNPFESLARSPSEVSVPYSVASSGSFESASSMYASRSGYGIIHSPGPASPSPWTPTTTEYLSTQAQKDSPVYPSVTMLTAKQAWGAAPLMSPGLHSIRSMSGSTYSRLPESKTYNGWSLSSS